MDVYMRTGWDYTTAFRKRGTKNGVFKNSFMERNSILMNGGGKSKD